MPNTFPAPEAPWLLLAAAALLAVAACGWAWYGQRRIAQLQAALAAQLDDGARLRETLDALQAAVALYDAQDRLVFANHDFIALYPEIAADIRPGRYFAELAAAAWDRGLLPAERGADRDHWIAQRVAEHQRGQSQLVRQMANGRWRRIVEQRLADGSILAHSMDITELLNQQRELEQAQRDAELARRRLSDAIEALPAGFELFDENDRLVLANQQMAAYYPKITDLLQQNPSFEELVRANHARGGLPALKTPAALEAWLADRLKQRRKPGRPRLLHMSGKRVVRAYEQRTRDGGLVGVRVDISESERQKAFAEAASARLHEAIEALPDAFALYDAEDRLVVCNSRYRELYRESAGAMVPGTTFEAILRYGLARGQYPQAAEREQAWLAERLQQHRDPGGPQLQELPGNRWLRIDERTTRSGGIAGVRSDVTELVRREQELRVLNAQLDAVNSELAMLSNTDALTSLANRRSFDRALDKEWSRASRHGMPLALLVIDIDHFKRFNDRYGHPAGDVCLRQVALLLQSEAARRPNDLVARIGGEEFAILLPHQTAQQALQLAQRCIAVVDGAAIEHAESPQGGRVTLSIGVADNSLVGEGGSGSDLLATADAALYRAKQTGRHRAECAVAPQPGADAP